MRPEIIPATVKQQDCYNQLSDVFGNSEVVLDTDYLQVTFSDKSFLVKKDGAVYGFLDEYGLPNVGGIQITLSTGLVIFLI